MAAELLLGAPLFPGDSGVDQLVEIIKVLGTPTKAEICSMNPNYTEFKFPQIKAHPWGKVFRPRTPPEALELVPQMLAYSPSERVTPLGTWRPAISGVPRLNLALHVMLRCAMLSLSSGANPAHMAR